MVARWQGRASRRLGWSAQRWIAGMSAPKWFRWIRNERFREAPKGPALDMNRIRRIAYL